MAVLWPGYACCIQLSIPLGEERVETRFDQDYEWVFGNCGSGLILQLVRGVTRRCKEDDYKKKKKKKGMKIEDEEDDEKE